MRCPRRAGELRKAVDQIRVMNVRQMVAGGDQLRGISVPHVAQRVETVGDQDGRR
jgi:hypothetical protein